MSRPTDADLNHWVSVADRFERTTGIAMLPADDLKELVKMARLGAHALDLVDELAFYHVGLLSEQGNEYLQDASRREFRAARTAILDANGG